MSMPSGQNSRRLLAAASSTAAIYDAAESCTKAPQPAARGIVEGGFVDRHAAPWRDTPRSHALRPHEVGMLDNSPNDLIREERARAPRASSSAS